MDNPDFRDPLLKECDRDFLNGGALVFFNRCKGFIFKVDAWRTVMTHQRMDTAAKSRVDIAREHDSCEHEFLN